MKVYLAADHAGLDIKADMALFIATLSTAAQPYDVHDCGAFEYDAADDYPDFIGRAAKLLAEDARAGIESRAIVFGGSGQGEAIVMNRYSGVRCALYYGEPGTKQIDASGKELDILTSSREHNNANALSIGARFVSTDAAKSAVKKWLTVGFSGDERHARRIKKIDGLQ